MASGVLIALVCAGLAFGLWLVLRRALRDQASHTASVQPRPTVAAAQSGTASVEQKPAVEQPSVAEQPSVVEQPVVLQQQSVVPKEPEVQRKPDVEAESDVQKKQAVQQESAVYQSTELEEQPVAAEETKAVEAREAVEVIEVVEIREAVEETEVVGQAEVVQQQEAEDSEAIDGPWVLELIDLEPGQGVLCARTSRDKCPDFEAARKRITEEFGLFSLGKINVDAVRKKECMVMLVSDLADLESNERIQQAHHFGVPVVLVADLLAAQHPDRVRAYLAPDRAADYRKTRGAFQAHWSKDTLRLSAGMRYFLTHSNAGCSLLTEEGDHLNAVIGPRLTLKGEVPEDQDVDMVVVPTLRTTSRKYLQVIERKQPVLVVKAEDIRHAALGDQVPAWRWQGGAYFQYPSLDRKA